MSSSNIVQLFPPAAELGCLVANQQGYEQDMRDHFRKHAIDTHVSPHTLLSEHFFQQYERLMVLFVVLTENPDKAGEIIEDLMSFGPVSYKDAFEHLPRADKDIALGAYDYCPEILRNQFDEMISDINFVMFDAVMQIDKAYLNGDQAAYLQKAREMIVIFPPILEMAREFARSGLSAANKNIIKMAEYR